MNKKNTPEQNEGGSPSVTPEDPLIRSSEEPADVEDEDVEDSADTEDDDDRAGVL